MASPALPPCAPAPNEAAARSSFDCEDPRVLAQQRAGEGGMLQRKHLLFAVVFGVYVGVVVYFATEPQQSAERAAGNRAPLKHAAFASSGVLPTPRRVLFTPAAAVREARMSMALVPPPPPPAIMRPAADMPAIARPAAAAALAPTQKREKTSFVNRAVKSVGPAVVKIDTDFVVEDGPSGGGAFPPGFLPPGVQPFGFSQEPLVVTEEGSGFIVSSDGLIMTNAHVVGKNSKVSVTLTDGSVLDGEVLGTDRIIDLAIVKVSPQGRKLPLAPIGKSADVEVGDFAIAIGNAVRLDNTVTLGVISALGRSGQELGMGMGNTKYLQTDAAINPGNSGGPLLNEFGEVIGINTAIRNNAAGISFAIPIDDATQVMDYLTNGRKIPRAYIGISYRGLTVDQIKRINAKNKASETPLFFDLPEVASVIVDGVRPDSPASNAGLKPFDILIELDGKPVKDSQVVVPIVSGKKVGEQLKCKVLRQGRELELVITVGDIPADMAARVPAR